MDADLQHDDTRLPDLLSQMKHADFAVGVRRPTGGTDQKAGWRSRFGRWFATVLAALIARVSLSDPMSGFFTMRRDVFTMIDDWALHPRGCNLLLYLYARAVHSLGRDQVRLSEVSYEMGQRQHGRSKLSAKVGVGFVMTLLDRRLHSRHQISRRALMPARS